MNTPVVFIIFNRPDTTEKVFAEIARARPPKLFVVADGPREQHPDDAARCAKTRAVTERVDWDCEVFRDYSKDNLGCDQRVATGISWVFNHVEEAIFLEDDCLPDPSFFPFCEELLERYRDDERIMKIGGRNDLSGKMQVPHSYFFWRMGGCWGWATWRRAWRHFDFDLKLWPQLRDTPWLMDILGNPLAVQYWHNIFERAYHDKRVGWDFRWAFSYWSQSGLAAAPCTNLVRNIGFSDAATHTRSDPARRGELKAGKIDFPLNHPPYVIRDTEAERQFLDLIVIPRLKKKTFKKRFLNSVSEFDRRYLNGNIKKIKENLL